MIRTTLVSGGGEVGGWDRWSAYTSMLLQITRDYPGLPDPRTLKSAEIRFFYDGLRNELKRHAKQSTT